MIKWLRDSAERNGFDLSNRTDMAFVSFLFTVMGAFSLVLVALVALMVYMLTFVVPALGIVVGGVALTPFVIYSLLYKSPDADQDD